MKDVTRRKALTGIGGLATVSIAGCTGSVMGDSEEYSEDDHEDLLLSEEDFPDDWHRDDEFNENFDAVFLDEDETTVVLVLVEIEDDVEEAEESFEQSESGAEDPSDYDIGDEAYWATQNDEIAVTQFRHSNAVGQVAATTLSGLEMNPDQNRSQQHAQEMFDGWE